MAQQIVRNTDGIVLGAGLENEKGAIELGTIKSPPNPLFTWSD